MIHEKHPNDGVLIRELRDALSELPVRERPPLAAIVNRGHIHRRRKRRGLASLSLVAVAAGGALLLGITGRHSAAPTRTTSAQSGSATPRTIRTAGFTLVSYTNGTAKLTFTNNQVFDPSALRRALAKNGISALVKTDVYCSSTPAPPDPSSIGVLSTRPSLKTSADVRGPKGLSQRFAGRAPRPNIGRLINHTVTVINRTKMPSETELAFDYAPGDHLLSVGLVYTNSHTCREGQPPAH
jgi:hypothetical protein